jgi:3-oxoadipate CoA-transferase beta subunit
MRTVNALTRKDIAWLVAQDIVDGSFVNLGIGIPTLVAEFLPSHRDIILHSENGILGMGPRNPDTPPDLDLVNPSKEYIGLIQGACVCDSVMSFTMMRGGHLDLTVLGAFQVSGQGDLANWQTDEVDAIPGVGGAMDLATGAKRVFVMMEHTTRNGEPKIVENCSFPLTGKAVVDRIYTDLAIIDATADGLVVRALIDGLTLEQLQSVTGVPLKLVHDHTVIKPHF